MRSSALKQSDPRTSKHRAQDLPLAAVAMKVDLWWMRLQSRRLHDQSRFLVTAHGVTWKNGVSQSSFMSCCPGKPGSFTSDLGCVEVCRKIGGQPTH